MITYKQIDKDERLACSTLSNFVKKHPYFTYFGGSIAVVFVFFSMTLIMMLAAVGGGTIETHSREMLATGEITLHQYATNMWVVDVVAWHYNFILALMNIVFVGIVLLLFYIIFKEYLKFKRDNL